MLGQCHECANTSLLASSLLGGQVKWFDWSVMFQIPSDGLSPERLRQSDSEMSDP